MTDNTFKPRTIRCFKCRSFRSNNSHLPCKRCVGNDFKSGDAMYEMSLWGESLSEEEYNYYMNLPDKPKKPTKHTHVSLGDEDSCLVCEKPAKNMNSDGTYWDDRPAKKHKDTTFTIAEKKVYLYEGFNPVRTFSEDAVPQSKQLRWMYDSGFDAGKEAVMRLFPEDHKFTGKFGERPWCKECHKRIKKDFIKRTLNPK